MLFHKHCMNSLPIWHIFQLTKYHLQKHCIVFSTLWHPQFAVLTYGSDKLSQCCCKPAEFGSIIVPVHNIKLKGLYPILHPQRHPDCESLCDIFSRFSLSSFPVVFSISHDNIIISCAPLVISHSKDYAKLSDCISTTTRRFRSSWRQIFIQCY